MNAVDLPVRVVSIGSYSICSVRLSDFDSRWRCDETSYARMIFFDLVFQAIHLCHLCGPEVRDECGHERAHCLVKMPESIHLISHTLFSWSGRDRISELENRWH